MDGAIERGLYAAIVGWEYLGELVGDRVFPVVVPEDADLPAVAYQRISGPRLLGQAGSLGVGEARIQVTVIAATYADAKQVAGGIRDLLNGYRGTLGGACEVWSCRVENEVDGYGAQVETATVRLDLWFLYRE